jgi:hypothetical protein
MTAFDPKPVSTRSILEPKGPSTHGINAAETETLEAVCDMETVHQARTGLSEDHREAVAAFR